MKNLLPLLLLPLLFSACTEDEKEREPQTPQEMYELAGRLLKPNVQGEQSDFEGALRWTRRAAEAGHLQAQLDMGGMYLNGGRLVKPDAAAAYRWFCRAAEQGSMGAEVFVGMLLYDGKGVEQNRDEALRHWRRAADAGVAAAQFRLGRVLVQQPESVQEGMNLLVLAAREGHAGGVPQAATALGNLYYKGTNGAPQDMEKAAKWYALGAGAGDPMAQLVYAMMLLTGENVARDEARGMAMLRMAAGQDYLPAMVQLIQRLQQDEGDEDKAREAAAWGRRLEELTAPKEKK